MQGARAPYRRLILLALYYDLPVYQDVYRLILRLFEITKDFPREYKYTLGHDLKRDGIVYGGVVVFSLSYQVIAQELEERRNSLGIRSEVKQSNVSVPGLSPTRSF